MKHMVCFIYQILIMLSLYKYKRVIRAIIAVRALRDIKVIRDIWVIIMGTKKPGSQISTPSPPH